LNTFQLLTATVLYSAAVFSPEVYVYYPHAGLVGFLPGVLGDPDFAFVQIFDVAVVEGEIGLVIIAIE